MIINIIFYVADHIEHINYIFNLDQHDELF